MSQTHNAGRADQQIRTAQQRIKEQKVRLRQSIVQGCPTQSAENILRDMEAVFTRCRDKGAYFAERQRHVCRATQGLCVDALCVGYASQKLPLL
jgi:hypothetical protein